MLEQPVNNEFLLKNPVSPKRVLLSFFGARNCKKKLLSFFGARKFNFLKYDNFFFRVFYFIFIFHFILFFFFLSLGLKVAQIAP